jgi:hypothetical protein
MIETRAPMFIPPLIQISGALPISLRAEVAAFWEAHLHGEFAGPLARALEQMDQSADFQARTQGDLLAYFAGKASETGTPGAAAQPTGSTPPPPTPTIPPVAAVPPMPPVPPTPPTPPVPPVSSAPPAPAAPALSEAPAQPPAGHLTPTAPIIPRAPATPATESAPRRGGWLRRLFGGRR